MRFISNFGACLSALCLAGLLGCSRSPEKSGDRYLAGGETQKAYQKYMEALNRCILQGQQPSAQLKSKILSLTIVKLDSALGRLNSNPDETNTEQIDLWRKDFQKFLPGVQNPSLARSYSEFLLRYANSPEINLNQALAVLQEVERLGMLVDQAKAQGLRLKRTYAGELLAEAQQMYENSPKKNDDKLVYAEYKTLLALKYDPDNALAKKLIANLRQTNLGSYSGYEKFEEKTDPDVDRYDIYLSVPRVFGSDNVNCETGVFNLSSNPIKVKSDYFYLVLDNNDTIRAAASSKLNNIDLENRMDTVNVLSFPLNSSKKGMIMKLVYNNGTKISEKFFK